MSRFLVVARRVAGELGGLRGLLVAALLVGLGVLLGAQSGGLGSGSRFAGAARAVFVAPLLLAGWGLARLPGAWPSELRQLPLPLLLCVSGPVAGASAALGLGLLGMALIAGPWLAGIDDAPPCRARVDLPLLSLRASAGRRPGASDTLQFLARAGDEASFAVPGGSRADQVELQLEVFLGAQEGSVDLLLRLGSAQMAIPPLRPGPCRLELPLADPDLPGTLGLVRRSDSGPLVALGEDGVRLRLVQPHSHVLNTALAFLSLLPLFLALAAVQLALAGVLAPGPRVLAMVLLFAWVLLVPGLSDGLKTRELAEGRWLADRTLWQGQLVPLVLCAAALLLALSTEALQVARRSVRP